MRDYLNIECKAPSYNTSAGWRDVIIEATDYRLAHYMRDQQIQDVFLGIAVGRFFMFFSWAPSAPYQNPLWMQGRGGQVHHFDRRLRHIGGNWVNPQTGEIIIANAIPINIDNHNATNRQLIENILLGVRASILPGENM